MNHVSKNATANAPHSNARVRVSELVSSRYDVVGPSGSTIGHERPLLWDDRKEGVDVVRVGPGEVVKLHSSYMQSPPKPGWIILLTAGDALHGYTWTLYGITSHQHSSAE